MKTKSATRPRRTKVNTTPDERDFPALDAWARNLKLEDGRPLTTAERREENLARSVGRPRKPDSAKARRIMISMTPQLDQGCGHLCEADRPNAIGPDR